MGGRWCMVPLGMHEASPDVRIERALCESWWIPDDVHLVETEDVVWVYSAERPEFNRCQRINTRMAQLESTVDFISNTHAQLGVPSKWSL